MDANIDQVVAKDVKLIEVIIPGKRNVGYEPGRAELPEGLYIRNVPYRRIVCQRSKIIKLKRHGERV